MGKEGAITMVIDADEIPGAPDQGEVLVEDPPVDPIEDPPIEDPPPVDPDEPPEVMGIEEDDEWRSQTTNRLDQIEKNQIGTTEVVSRLEKKEKSRKKPQRKGRKRQLRL